MEKSTPPLAREGWNYHFPPFFSPPLHGRALSRGDPPRPVQPRTMRLMCFRSLFLRCGRTMEIACQAKQNGQFLLPFPLLGYPDGCLLTREGFVATFHSSVQRSFSPPPPAPSVPYFYLEFPSREIGSVRTGRT